MVVIETDRMTLRQMGMPDVDHLLGIFADPEAMRYYPSTKDITETRRWPWRRSTEARMRRRSSSRTSWRRGPR